jgi:hypothetical protein
MRFKKDHGRNAQLNIIRNVLENGGGFSSTPRPWATQARQSLKKRVG